MGKTDLVHFLPFKDNRNVRCLNGSAHVRTTYLIEFVTCPLCLDENECKTYWVRHEEKNGNAHKVFN